MLGFCRSFLDQVWMSHGDQLSALPKDFHVIGHTNSAPYAAIAHNSKPCYGIQFHPEVTHSPRGKEVISRFILDICKCRPNWTMACAFFFAPAGTDIDCGLRHDLIYRKSLLEKRLRELEIFVVQKAGSLELSVVGLIVPSPQS